MRYRLLALLAGAGLLASMACHLMAWLKITPPLGKAVFMLHVGIFAVWFPLIILGNRMAPKGSRGVDSLIKELPKWVSTALGGLFAYALCNFAYFLYCTSSYPKHKVPFWLELRGFSGHWMIFYSVACAGFVAMMRLSKKQEDAKG
jgi:hypothetical protein